MKIAHLVPTLHPDAPEIGLVDLAGAAQDTGMELVVIALASTSETSQVSALQRLGVPVSELGLGPWDPRAVGRTAQLIRDQRVQLVHTHLPPADVVGAAAALRNRLPAVSTLHRIENLPADRIDRFKRTAKILARQRFMARTIAISQVQREWYRGLSGAGSAQNLVVVPNGVTDPGPVAPAERQRRRSALGVGDGEVLAVSTAPMRRDQGHELLLEALESLPDGLRLVVALAGDGPLRPWLESRVDASDDLTERVRFVHRHQEPTALLGAADLVLHTARSGAAPTALLRAMAAGVPAVATRVGGVPEIVTADTGVLVALHPAAITDALVALTEDGARRERLGTAARERFLAEYEAIGWARRLHELYQEVLTPGRADLGEPQPS
ncbi:glycosyltransferase [Pseudonocardia xinjiangensis]|uniref:glycosyltransferase n=1 Tax=Pseudonocardia xinjiangensis TaxID=75289 RepID=UPI003D94EE1E